MAKDKKPAHLDLSGLTMAQIIEKMNAKYGANTLALASQAAGLRLEFYSTGNYALDIALGGGIPRNRITEFHGGFSSLKSTQTLKVLEAFQNRHPDGLAFYEDGEHAFDPLYAERLGVNTDEVSLINSDSGEQAIDVMSDLTSAGRDMLVIVDSIATLIPTAELESSAEQQFQGLHPRLVARMMRVLVGRQKRSMYDSTAAATTILATNQVREAIGVLYGDPTRTPGGKTKDHYYSVIVRFLSSPGDRLMEKITRNGIEREMRFGQKVRFTIKKNKVSGSQHEEGEFTYYTRPHEGHAAFSFDNEEVLFRMGRYYGVIKMGIDGKTPKFTYRDLYGKEAAFKQSLITDSAVSSRLYGDILRAVLTEDKELLSGGLASVEDEEDEVVATPVKKKVRFS